MLFIRSYSRMMQKNLNYFLKVVLQYIYNKMGFEIYLVQLSTVKYFLIYEVLPLDLYKQRLVS